MKSTSLGSLSGGSYTQPVKIHNKSIKHTIEQSDTSFHAKMSKFCSRYFTLCINKSCARVSIILLYLSVTILDLVRGIIHTFLYENGLNDISGLATGDVLCDGRLSAIMIGYGGANLESFLLRSYIFYCYTRYNNGRDLIRVSSVASALSTPITEIVSFTGNFNVGDAEVPGRYAMIIRSVASIVTVFLTFL